MQSALALSLFVLRCSANHAYDTLSLDDFAMRTDFFDRWPDFHVCVLSDIYRMGSFQPLLDPLAKAECNAHGFSPKYVRESHGHYPIEHEKLYSEELLLLLRPYESRLFLWP